MTWEIDLSAGALASGEGAVLGDWYSSVQTTIGLAATTLTLDTERQGSIAFTLAASEITINESGKFYVEYDVTLLQQAATYDVEMWLELNAVEVPGTRAKGIVDTAGPGSTTGHAAMLLDLGIGDVVRIRAQSSAASAESRADGVRLNIHSPGAAAKGDYSIPFGARFGNAGQRGRFHFIHGAASASNGTTLDADTQGAVIQDGRITKMAWSNENGDATTVYKILVNGLVEDTLTLTPGQSGTLPTSSPIPVNGGDLVAVEYDDGTPPQDSAVELYVEGFVP